MTHASRLEGRPRRLRSRATLATLVVVAALLAGCPPSSLIGQPCEDPGETQCEDEKLLRCDGSFYVLLAACAQECVAGLPEVEHASATIDTDETWACVDGPHFVPGPITVAPGVTLTLEAGARILLNPASHIDVDPAGRVDAQGTAEAPILITSKTGLGASFGAGASGGLNVFAVTQGTPSTVEHTIIEHGIQGLGVFGLAADATPPVIENNTLRDNENFGIFITCGEVGAPIPDFAGDGNQFFGNKAGDVSSCD